MYRILIFLSIALTGYPFESVQAQWARGKGHGYAQISIGYARADQAFSSTRTLGTLGSVSNPLTYTDGGVYLYAEYGLTNRLTLIGSTYAKRMQVQGQIFNYETGGLADASVYLRYTFQPFNGLVVSPQIGLKLPTGYNADYQPPLGSGQTDMVGMLTAGYSFYPLPAYFSAGLGYNSRGGVPVNELSYFAELGYGIGPVYLRGRLDGIESTSNTSSLFSITSQVPEQGYLNAGPGLTISFSDKLKLNADFRFTLNGRTAAQITSGTIGLAWVW